MKGIHWIGFGIFLFICLAFMIQVIDQTPSNNVNNNSNLSSENSSNLSSENSSTITNSSLQVTDSCAQINEKMLQIDCYLALAEETDNTLFCDKATVGDTDEEFWSVVNKYGPDYLIWVDRHQAMCYEGIAKATNNPEICNKINPSDMGDEKIAQCKIKSGENPETQCDLMSDYDDQQDCYKDYYICEKIDDGSCGNRAICVHRTKDDCYSYIASSTQDINYCKNIVDETAQEYCVKAYAINNNVPDLCNTLTIQKIKIDCIENLDRMNPK